LTVRGSQEVGIQQTTVEMNNNKESFESKTQLHVGWIHPWVGLDWIACRKITIFLWLWLG